MWRKLVIALILLTVWQPDVATAGKCKKLLNEIIPKMEAHIKYLKEKIPTINFTKEEGTKFKKMMEENTESLLMELHKDKGDILKVMKKHCKPKVNDKEEMPLYYKLVFDDEGYIMVFRLTAGIKKPAFEKYIDTGNSDDENDLVFFNVPCGCKTTNGSRYCDRHYRSHLMDLWPHLALEKAKVCTYNQGLKTGCIVFDGKDSNSMTFFEQARIIQDPYVDLSATEPPNPNYFSIEGEDISPTHKRRFFINNNDGGCSNTAGWLVVGDGSCGPKTCQWEQMYGKHFPFILYANTPSGDGAGYTKTIWERGNPGQADVLTVSIKLRPNDQCPTKPMD